jgi:hypothetical protein
MILDRDRGRMGVAITFCDQPKHECDGNEHCYPSLSRREAESLPHFIEAETPAFFSHKVTSAASIVIPFAAAELKPNDSVS